MSSKNFLVQQNKVTFKSKASFFGRSKLMSQKHRVKTDINSQILNNSHDCQSLIKELLRKNQAKTRKKHSLVSEIKNIQSKYKRVERSTQILKIRKIINHRRETNVKLNQIPQIRNNSFDKIESKNLKRIHLGKPIFNILPIEKERYGAKFSKLIPIKQSLSREVKEEIKPWEIDCRFQESRLNFNFSSFAK